MNDEIRQALIAHGKRRAAARRKARQESEAISALIPRALEAGMSKSEIARLAQITRPALDTMLRDA
jgi:hypothetical protein